MKNHERLGCLKERLFHPPERKKVKQLDCQFAQGRNGAVLDEKGFCQK
jgi:hypothetical protein